MPKRFALKIYPTNALKLGDATFQTIEVNSVKFCIVSVPGLREEDVNQFRDIWQETVGDNLDLILVNYECNLNEVEIVEVDPPSRYEREPVI
jgi:hypothetical protein